MVMRTPHPYRQELDHAGRVIRIFDPNVDPEDLIWHQDRHDREVRIVESNGWKLQLETGLPFQLIDGKTYSIPARSWHRILRGAGQLVIEIIEIESSSD